MNRYIVVSGLPASGKSTLAKALAVALELPVLDKDDLLEALFESEGVGDLSWRRRLSQTADCDFRRKAERSSGAILTSWWRHPRSEADSGTPTDWLRKLPGCIVEVHCHCSPNIAANRFTSRKRHTGHLDHRWSYIELLANFEIQSSLGPLGIAHVLAVQTEGESTISSISRGILTAFER